MTPATSISTTSTTGVEPDPRLCGVWSREHLAGVAARHSDTRIIYMPDRTGRYEIPFLISAGLLFIGVVSSLFIDPTRRILEYGTSTAVVEGVAL